MLGTDLFPRASDNHCMLVCHLLGRRARKLTACQLLHRGRLCWGTAQPLSKAHSKHVLQASNRFLEASTCTLNRKRSDHPTIHHSVRSRGIDRDVSLHGLRTWKLDHGK